jgi:hypothetical protein
VREFADILDVDHAIDEALESPLCPGDSEESNFNHRFIKMVTTQNGEPISLGRVCTNAFKHSFVVNSRCVRVQGSSFPAADGDGDRADGVLHVGTDVVAAFIKTEAGVVSLAVGTPTGFRLNDSGPWEDWAPQEYAGSRELRVKLNIFKLEQLEETYASYAFLQSSSLCELNTRGCHYFAIDVVHSLRNEEEGEVESLADLKFDCTIAKDEFNKGIESALSSMDDADKKVIGVVGKTSKVPYKLNSASGKASIFWLICYVTGGSIDIHATKKTKYDCKFCPAKFTQTRMIEHLAWHRHYDSSFDGSVVHAEYPCGNCGLKGVQKDEPGGCQVWTSGSKKKRTTHCNWICMSFMEGIEQRRSFKVWKGTKKDSPSRDFPLNCNVKGCRAVHWKFNMGKHFSAMHKGLRMNKRMRNLLAPVDEEMDQLTAFAAPNKKGLSLLPVKDAGDGDETGEESSSSEESEEEEAKDAEEGQENEEEEGGGQ